MNKMQRNDLCWCHSGKKWKKCHYPHLSPHTMQDIKKTYAQQYQILIKSKEEIEKIKRACELTAEILDLICQKVVPGITTKQLDQYSIELHKKANAIPACLGYGEPPFPATICTSINEEICHGIPNDIPLKEGDIVNIDASCILDNYYGDTSRMVIVGGKTTQERQKVVDVSYQSLIHAIKIVKPGVPICKIGEVISDYAESQGCSVVYQFVAHGVGIHFHEMPQIPHNRNQISIPLVPGMTFTIEPMINAGQAEAVIDKDNQWIARTIDGKASAQWEHTIVVTDEGCEILTQLPTRSFFS